MSRFKILVLVLFALSLFAAIPSKVQAQTSQIPLQCKDTSGSGVAQACNTVLTLGPVSGDSIIYTTTTANTGDVTVNVDGKGPIHIRKWLGSSVLIAGDLPPNVPVQLIFDGTYWEIQTIGNPPTGTGNVSAGSNFSAKGNPIISVNNGLGVTSVPEESDAAVQSGSDYCAQVNTNWSSISSNISTLGGVNDARALTGGTNPCAGSFLSSYPSNFTGMLEFGSDVQLQLSTQILFSQNGGLIVDGNSGHPVDGATPYGTSFEPSNSFPTNTALVQIGTSSVIPGVAFENIRLSCLPPSGTPIAGCIPYKNLQGEEGTSLWNVWLASSPVADFYVAGSGAQQGGPYLGVTASGTGVNSTSAVNFQLGDSTTTSLLANSTLMQFSGGGTANAAAQVNCGTVDFTTNWWLESGHCEDTTVGIEIGANHLAHNIAIMNWGFTASVGKPMTTAIDLAPNNDTNVMLMNISAPASNLTNIVNDRSTTFPGTITAAGESGLLGWYFRSANSIFTSSNQVPDVWPAHNENFASSTIKMPQSAGFAAGATSTIGYDTTNKNTHVESNGGDGIVAPLAAGFVSGDCGQPTQTGGVWVTADAGAGCGSGGGSVSGQASGVIPLGTSATVIGGQSHMNDGNTTAGTITSSEPFVATSLAAAVSANPGLLTLPGNTGTPSIGSGLFGILGPPTASFTSYVIQMSSTAPSGTQELACGTPVSNISACSWISGSGAVGSVSNSDGTLTISPTTGLVVASLNLAQANSWSAAGAASTPGLSITGAPYTAGSGTTNFPQLYINDGTGPTTLSTAGTEFGINTPSGFVGNLEDYHVNGGVSVANLSYLGAWAALSYTSNGTTAGFIDLPQGSTSASVAPCNVATSICIQAPTSVTSYLLVLPGAQPTAGNTALNCTAANPSVCSWSTGGGGGGVSSIATTSPITGGTITSTGTIACATCVTSASSLTSTAFMTGAGSQGSQTPSTTATLSSGGAPTFPGIGTFSGAGAASTPGLTVTGAPYTGGSATTNFPQLYINDGTGPTTFSTAGTEFGINTPSGFTGNLLDGHVNGGASIANLSYQGAWNALNYTSIGTTAGFIDFPQGSTSASVAPCNTSVSICEQAPTSVTAYLITKPGAAPTVANSYAATSTGGVQSWASANELFCGTAAACSATAESNMKVVFGSAPLSSGAPSTVTITGISPAFTATADYVCTVSAPGSTAATALLGVSNVSSSSFTITGPASVTTVVSYICVGF